MESKLIMQLKELLERLSKFNPETEVNVVAHCKAYNFTVSYGGSDGGAEKDAMHISFYVDELCQSEKPDQFDIIP